MADPQRNPQQSPQQPQQQKPQQPTQPAAEKRASVTVRNNQASMRTIPFPKGTVPGAGVVLYPGLNVVSSDEWDQVNANAMIVKLFKTKLPEHEPNKNKRYLEVVGVDLTDGLSRVDPELAIDLVEETVNQALLEAWKTQETRPAVSQAIQKQLDKIDPTKTVKEDEKDHAADED